MLVVHGLKNCDTCRKARKWLDAEGIAHRFHDLRADGVDPATIAVWCAALGWEAVLNKRGTTWRKLPDRETANLDEARAIALMAAHPALVKRPVFELGGGRYVLGFGADQQAALRGSP